MGRRLDNDDIWKLAVSKLTFDEILDCFGDAIEKLEDDDKVEIKQMIATADKKLKNVGRMSSLDLVGKIAIREVLE
jgi:hypothetical protein